jgi:hypothetical protein
VSVHEAIDRDFGAHVERIRDFLCDLALDGEGPASVAAEAH